MPPFLYQMAFPCQHTNDRHIDCRNCAPCTDCMYDKKFVVGEPGNKQNSTSGNTKDVREKLFVQPLRCRAKKREYGKERVAHQSKCRYRYAKKITCRIFPYQFTAGIDAYDGGLPDKTLRDIERNPDAKKRQYK